MFKQITAVCTNDNIVTSLKSNVSSQHTLKSYFFVKARILTSFNQVAVNFLNQIYNIFRERERILGRETEREREGYIEIVTNQA